MRLRATAVTLVAMLMFAACGGGAARTGVNLSQTAARQVGTAVGDQSVTAIRLTADDVTALANRVDVDGAVIRQVAPEVEQQSVWQGSINGVKTVYQQTPTEVRSNLVGVACDGLYGRISTRDELLEAVAERFAGLGQDDATAFAGAVVSLWEDLYEASQSAKPEDRAAAALTCFAVEQAAG